MKPPSLTDPSSPRHPTVSPRGGGSGGTCPPGDSCPYCRYRTVISDSRRMIPYPDCCCVYRLPEVGSTAGSGVYVGQVTCRNGVARGEMRGIDEKTAVKTFPATVCSDGSDRRRPGKSRSRDDGDQNNDPTIFPPTHGDHCHRHLACCSRIGPLEAFSTDILNYRSPTLLPNYRPPSSSLTSSSDHVIQAVTSSMTHPPPPQLVSVAGTTTKTAGALEKKTSESRVEPGSSRVFRRSRAVLGAVVCMTCLVFVSLGTVVCLVLAFGRRSPEFRHDVTGSEGRQILPVEDKSLASKSSQIFTTSDPNLEQKQYDKLSVWGQFPKGSPNGSRYFAVNRPFTFHTAQEFCLEHGGYLAHINSLREQLYLEEFLTTELQNTGEDSTVAIGYWIGAKRARGSHDGKCMYDQWKWIDGFGRSHGAIAGLTAFIPGKPDNYYDPEECLFISYKDSSDDSRYLKWDDAPCDLNSLGNIRALCEVEIR